MKAQLADQARRLVKTKARANAMWRQLMATKDNERALWDEIHALKARVRELSESLEHLEQRDSAAGERRASDSATADKAEGKLDGQAAKRPAPSAGFIRDSRPTEEDLEDYYRRNDPQ